MPLNSDALKRRRLLLGFSQADLAIVAGLSDATVGRLERGGLANGGGSLAIDTVARIAIALRMELHELILPPAGNKYETAVRFAHEEHSPSQAPHLHDRGRSIKAQGIRRMTGVLTASDQAVLARDEPRDDSLHGFTAAKVTLDENGEPVTERVDPAKLEPSGWSFTDTSSE